MSDNIARFDHDPQGLLEDCATRWIDEKLRASIVVVVDDQDRLIWDSAAYKRKDLLWAIEKLKLELLGAL